MADIAAILKDLQAEGADLDQLVADLDDEQWRLSTPAQGWTIAHQIAHLAWTDQAALAAISAGLDFAELVESGMKDPAGFIDAAAEKGAKQSPSGMLDGWRTGREALAKALAERESSTKIPWFGPPMSAASMATARLMETWAHGQDVADALGVKRVPTDRLKNIAHLGVRTRDFSFVMSGLTPPEKAFRVELIAPDGQVWIWGQADAEQHVCGSAENFCLLVTRRRHPEDLDLEVKGEDAKQWVSIAQAFAGPPGTGRESVKNNV
ncbi:MAG: TIGR03084 family metal-binding protein [Mycobacteriaceae bacterium]